MRRLATIILGLVLALGAYAQGTLTFTTSGGLTVDVPDRYLVAEIAPLRVGLTDRETGASLLLSIEDTDANPDALVAAEFRRLGIGPDAVQPRALSASTSNAEIVGARGTRAAGTVVVASVAFENVLGLLVMQPADSVPLPVIKSVIESIRLAEISVESAYPACGSPELPQTIRTSGGLSACFPQGFAGEEKGANAIGIADMERGVIISIYARGDLRTLIGAEVNEAAAAATAFAETLRSAGALVFDTALESIALDSGTGFAIPVAYPTVGSGRVLAAQAGSEVVLLSAILIGTPPSDIVEILGNIVNSTTLGEPGEDMGTVRPADRVIHLGTASFTTAPGWTLISNEGGLAALERSGGSALMSVAAAPLDSSWNAETYKRSVLSASAQFAGDTAFDPTALEVTAQEAGAYTLELYDSSVTAPDAAAAVNLTAILTLENRALAVFQLTAARAAYSADMRDEVVQMALSAVQP